GNLFSFGELLHEAWQAKRSLSTKVSNGEVDHIYERAIKAGALGGKLLGAGGGGFLLLFAAPEKHQFIRETLEPLIYVPFKFEFSGSQIIFVDLQEDYSEFEKPFAENQIAAFHELGTNTSSGGY